jgi:phytol kinase
MDSIIRDTITNYLMIMKYLSYKVTYLYLTTYFISMKWDFLREVSRKIVHMLILLVIAGYVIIDKIYGKIYALMALILLLLLFLILEYIRLDLEIKMPLFDYLIRPRETNQMYGVIYFISATIICLSVFDFRIALTALLMTTFGDMSAALFGQKFGKTVLFKKKTIVGGGAELIVNMIIGILILINYSNIYTIIVMALTATVVEILVENIEDNLAVPLFTGFIGQLLIML